MLSQPFSISSTSTIQWIVVLLLDLYRTGWMWLVRFTKQCGRKELVNVFAVNCVCTVEVNKAAGQHMGLTAYRIRITACCICLDTRPVGSERSSSEWQRRPPRPCDVHRNVKTRSSATAEEPCEHTAGQLKSCKMLHKCSTDCIWKRLQAMNDLQCHSRSLPLLPFDRPYTVSY